MSEMVHAAPSPLVSRAATRAARLLVVIAIAVAALVAFAAPASAHGTLVGSNPTPGAVLAKAPASVKLHFDEGITTVPEALRVLGPDGSRVDAGDVHQSGNGSDLSVDLRDATRHGSYFVSWRVVSADSHPISGSFTFAVGKASAAPAGAAATDGGPGIAIALGVSRWAGYIGLVLLLGGAVFLSLCWPAGWSSRRARILLTVGWAGGVGAALLGLALKGPDDAGFGVSQALRWDLVTEVLGTTYGKALVARLVLLAGIGIWLGRSASKHDHDDATARIPGARSRWAGALVGGGLLATVSTTGHAVVGSGRLLALPSDMAHLAAMSVWVGGLVMLGAVLLPLGRPVETKKAVPAFSRMAAAAVGVLVVTGTYQGWRQVGSLPALRSTTYGRELMVKVALVAAAVGLGAVSRAWVRRHYPSSPTVVYAASAADLRRPPASPPPGTTTEVPRIAMGTLRRSVLIEAVIATVVLAVTSVLVATAPAVTAYRPSVAQTLHFGPDSAKLSAVPLGDRQMDLHIYFFGPNGAPTDPPEVKATLRLADQDLGPASLALQGLGAGHETATVAVPVQGDWTLTVSARTTPINVYSQDVVLPVR
jgi:copper transport protein